MDFTIADRFGKSAVLDTYKRAFNEWKENYEYLTELVMVLNHKIWQWWESGNKAMAAVYDKLWREADEYAVNNLKDDELTYFYKVTD